MEECGRRPVDVLKYGGSMRQGIKSMKKCHHYSSNSMKKGGGLSSTNKVR
jgi:hypothetical protein